VAEGDPEGARMILEMVWEQVESVVYLLQHDLMVPLLVSLRRDTGDESGAAALADVVAVAAARSDVASVQATARRCRGLAQGDPGPILGAIELARTSPRRLSHACTLEDGARLLVGAGRAGDARPLVEEAIGLLEQLGAAGWTARLDPLVEATGIDRGRTPAPRATHGWESLSPKEHEVVSLIADGLSNPEIADRLFISRRTVESHLSHVFRKLDLSNRTQLARASLERER
jgi:DNA-binding CsgD family transcriptional regulator